MAENLNQQEMKNQDEDLTDDDEDGESYDDNEENYGFNPLPEVKEKEKEEKEEKEKTVKEEKKNEAEKERMLGEISAMFRGNPRLKLRSTIEELEALRGKSIEEVRNIHSNAINDIVEEKGTPAAEFTVIALTHFVDKFILHGIQSTLLSDEELLKDIDLFVRTRMGSLSLTTNIAFRVANNVLNLLRGIEAPVERARKRRKLEADLQTYGIDPAILDNASKTRPQEIQETRPANPGEPQDKRTYT